MQRSSIVVVPLLLVAAACSAQGEADPGTGVGTSAGPPTSSSAAPVAEGAVRDLTALAADLEAAVRGNRGLVVSMMGYVGQDGEGASVAVGLAQREPRRPVDAADTVMVLSITKSVLATAVMSLVEDGRLRLDDTVEDLLPGLVDRGDEITVEHLLSMTSGLASYDTSPDYPGGGQLPGRRLVALNQALDSPMSFDPGEQGEESNTNYAVLGLVVEKVSGRPFADVVRQRVLVPAGMDHTAFGGAPEVHGYDGRDDVTVVDPPHPSAAAGLVSTVEDIGRFLTALADGRLVDRATLAEMTRARAEVDGDDYGLGLRLRTTDCGDVIGQLGGGSGEAMSAWVAPATGRVVVVSSDLTAAALGQQVVDELVCD